MAKANPILADLRGSIAGNTWSRNRFGAYVRSKVSPVNPNSTRQNQVRTRFSNISTRWSDTLTSAQRTGWKNYADGTPLTDQFGNPKILTGNQMYVRTNTVALNSGVAAFDTAPFIPGQAAQIPVNNVNGNSNLTDSASGTPDNLQVVLAGVPQFPTGIDGTSLSFYIGLPLSPGATYYSGPWFLLGSVLGDSGSPPAQFNGAAPFALTAGVVYTIKFRYQDGDGKLAPSAQFNKTCVNIP